MSIGSRIKLLREQHELSQEELGTILGTTKQTIFKYENNIITNIPLDKIERLAEYMQVSPAYIMGWENYTDNLSSIGNIKNISDGIKRIPLIGTIACGKPLLAVENAEDYVNIDSSIHADFALRCKGDSMINARIFDGDIVYIKKQPTVENGEIAAVIIQSEDTEATLKRVYFGKDSVRLSAENPMYHDLVFTDNEADSVTIIGKAVAFLSTIR